MNHFYERQSNHAHLTSIIIQELALRYTHSWSTKSGPDVEPPSRSVGWRQRKQNSGKVANPKWVSPFVKRHSKLHRDKELLRCQFPRIGNWHTSDLISRLLACNANVRKRTYWMCIITFLTSVQIMHRVLQVQQSCKFSRNRTKLTLLAIHSKSNCKKKHGLWKLVQGCVKRI